MSQLVEALQDRDLSALEGLLAAEVAFHSPVRTYRDRRDVVHLLDTLAGLFDDLQLVREWPGPGGVASFIEVDGGDRRLDGVIEEIRDPDGKITEVTLMLRPLGPLLKAVERMGQALEDAPLPSGTTLTKSG
jgi:hypothetical protein